MKYARGPHLEVGAAHKARVHVDAAQAHAAALLKVKVQVLHTPIHMLVAVGRQASNTASIIAWVQRAACCFNNVRGKSPSVTRFAATRYDLVPVLQQLVPMTLPCGAVSTSSGAALQRLTRRPPH